MQDKGLQAGRFCCEDLGRLNKRLSSATATTTADRVAELDGQIKLVVGLREEVPGTFGREHLARLKKDFVSSRTPFFEIMS